MAKKLIGYYENPKPEDAKKIAADAKAFADIEEAKEKGWIFVGTTDKDSTQEDSDRIFEKICEILAKNAPGVKAGDES